MKIGDKVVCIAYSWIRPGPKENEICIVDNVFEFMGMVFLHIKGYEFTTENGNRIDYNARYFRPIDYSFGEKIAEQIESEQLTVEVCHINS